jgi:hypothetical protein
MHDTLRSGALDLRASVTTCPGVEGIGRREGAAIYSNIQASDGGTEGGTEGQNSNEIEAGQRRAGEVNKDILTTRGEANHSPTETPDALMVAVNTVLHGGEARVTAEHLREGGCNDLKRLTCREGEPV